MEGRKNFNGLVLNTCVKIIRQCVFCVMILYLMPLLTLSIEVIKADQSVVSKVISSVFLNVFSWIYICIVFILIVSLNLRTMLKIVKKEMDMVYHKSMWLSSYDIKSDALILEEFIETSRRIDNMQKKIKAMIQSEKKQKEDLIFKVSAASHDLKSPLTVIQGNSELLLYTQLEKQQKMYLEDIISASRQMNNYFNVLIDYSKTFYDDKSEWKIYSIKKVIEMVKEGSFFSVKDKSVLSVIDCADESRNVYMNLNYVIRAMTNLMNNAWEYAKTDCRKIELKIETSDNKLIFSVYNNGASFSAEVLENCGKLFYRQNKDRNISEEHYGIGLAFVKQVARLHSGNFIIKNVDEGVLASLELRLKN